jgi:two-component system invasion response regulator UvrY
VTKYSVLYSRIFIPGGFKLIKTILIDDHQLVRSGIREMLRQEKAISVLGEAGTGREVRISSPF